VFQLAKLLVIILFVAGSIDRASAQEQYNLKFGIDASIGLPTKNSPFGYGLGIDVIAKYKLSEELAVVAGIGYSRLSTKDTSLIPDYDFIPVKVGVKIYPFMPYIYFNGTVGAGFGIPNGSKTAFIFGGGGGYEWKDRYDFSIKYESYQLSKKSINYQSLNGQFAIVFAYNFE
jgi:hypothetical protein